MVRRRTRSGLGEDPWSHEPTKYRPHRPRRLQCGNLQEFRAVDTTLRYRPREDYYRPPLGVSTAKDLLGLQVFYPLHGPRGRCGRYVNDLYGYIGVVQVNEGCCQVISRG